jgi:phosphoribosylglycinamide formyltransferase-1
MVFRLGWFSTGRDKAASDLLKGVINGINSGYIRAEIAYVFSNRAPGEKGESDSFFNLVRDMGITLLNISSSTFYPKLHRKGINDPESMIKWRIAYDREIENLIERWDVDLIVLAGYMLIVGPDLCKRFRMINLHPAKPGGPCGTWQEVIWKLIDTRADETGVTIHLVTEELDKGPPITYCTFPIMGEKFDHLWKDTLLKVREFGLNSLIEDEGEQNPLFRKIREEGVIREIPLIIETIRVIAEGKIRVGTDGPYNEGGQPIEPLCLNEEIEKMIKRHVEDYGGINGKGVRH